MRHVAHIREDQSEQLLSEHLKGTAGGRRTLRKYLMPAKRHTASVWSTIRESTVKNFRSISAERESVQITPRPEPRPCSHRRFCRRLCGGRATTADCRRRREGGYGRPDADGAHEKEGVPLPRFPPGDLAAGLFAGRAGQGGSLRPVRLHTHAVLLSGRCGFFGYGMVHEGRPGG